MTASPSPHSADEVYEICAKILDIVLECALHKFGDTKQKLALGRPKFLETISHFVTRGERVEMCLPGFPFKSSNKVYKVLGKFPDKAEELALDRLNTMCMKVHTVYAPGAVLTIISDGLVYNGLFDLHFQICVCLVDVIIQIC
jgi:pyoverdine/dityrosine biosynthesis protein Dit1